LDPRRRRPRVGGREGAARRTERRGDVKVRGFVGVM
jgi:hypothetical protein